MQMGDKECILATILFVMLMLRLKIKSSQLPKVLKKMELSGLEGDV